MELHASDLEPKTQAGATRVVQYEHVLRTINENLPFAHIAIMSELVKAQPTRVLPAAKIEKYRLLLTMFTVFHERVLT